MSTGRGVRGRGRRWSRRTGVAVAVTAVAVGGLASAPAASAQPPSSAFSPKAATAAPVNLWITQLLSASVVEVSAGDGPSSVVVQESGQLTAPAAVDAAGDVYVVNQDTDQVLEVPAGGGPEVTIATGLLQPTGVAVDAAGDVYITDYQTLIEVPAGGGPQVTVAGGFEFLSGVAVDRKGDVFVAAVPDLVVKIPAGGGPQVRWTVGTGGGDDLGEIAVDPAGDVYVADDSPGAPAVVKIPADGGPRTTVGTGLTAPIGVAVDAAGDVFIVNLIVDAGLQQLVEVPAGGGAQVILNAGPGDAFAVAVAPGFPPGRASRVRGRSRSPGTARVRFTPGRTGGDPVTYQVTATDRTHPAQPTATLTTPTSPVVFHHLVGGDRYTFTVSAVNAAGRSQLSHPSAPIRIRDHHSPH